MARTNWSKDQIKHNPRALLFYVAVVALAGWLSPAVAVAPPKEPANVKTLNLNKFIPSIAKPNYEVEILAPLKDQQIKQARAQQEAARIAALRAAEAAEEARKAQEASQAAQAAATPPAPPQQVTAPTGGCYDWMRQAGVTDIASAYQLVMWESGCRPSAVNASSGACGLGQQLPCGKWPHAWNDPVGGLIDMQEYVMSRYGSWGAALAFHLKMGWY